MTPGVLFLVVGASGAGKDTLIDGARRSLGADDRYFFPRRTITRPSDAGGERHVAMKIEAFEAALGRGAFSLFWRAHGHAYGVPRSIEGVLGTSRHVVVNVSRSVISRARTQFPRVRIIHVVAPPGILAQRLVDRRRESRDMQAMRLQRGASITVEGDDVTKLVNDGSKVHAIRHMVSILEDVRAFSE